MYALVANLAKHCNKVMRVYVFMATYNYPTLLMPVNIVVPVAKMQVVLQ
jgi:hypothetical protein